ncbi:serine carboxypeptidase-like protein 2 [Cinnamomum micranthum f. kanehirae]|uniref:Serine carboxypeptidase-like protein 2 n=1 Tax=Cinnamomum micranthum f. kanehirae TaxID=337451 RepID=A0A443NNS4_9MAGN|nr:serine carboxypeptidase-like protein 2 [Cinnamomum micranthum f. kanehirae]
MEKGTVGEWVRCNFGLPYIHEITSSIKYHLNLTTKGYRSLVYSGDHDSKVPFVGTQAWIRSLNFSIIDEWRSWWVDGQVAGYTRTYANNLTFATVKARYSWEEDIQRQSTNLRNALLCSINGFLINLCKRSFIRMVESTSVFE